jgi:aldose 1-epimerase
MDTSNRQFCFTHPNGEDIYLFRLYNSKDTEVLITNYGAIITAFKIIQRDGSVNDIVLGFDKIESYSEKEYLAVYPYFGAAIGRYGNRIKSGKFEVDGKKYSVVLNWGSEHLHGGFTGFDKRVWTCDSNTASALVLKYKSPDGEEGYPGNLEVTLRFELNEENELSHTYTAVTDKATPVNLTHHSYFNLNNGQGTIGDHILKINAGHILEQDENCTVTGKLLSVDNTQYDFRKARPINKNWEPSVGYDQSFVVNQQDEEPAAEVWSEQSGIRLQVFTTEPIVHFYTGGGIPSLSGKQEKKYGPFSGFCLETQIHPNAINIPHFPDTILRPGQQYRHQTIYRILG